MIHHARSALSFACCLGLAWNSACSSKPDDDIDAAAVGDGAPLDAPPGADASPTDAPPIDAPVDAGAIDAAVDAGVSCMAPVPPAGCISGLAIGTDHTCALRNGEVWCWGVNGPNGLLGYDNTVDFTVTTPVQVVGLTGVVQIAAAGTTTCALRNDLTVWCWGQGDQGQVGNGMANTSNPLPVQVVGVGGVGHLTDIVHITGKSSGSHFCALACSGASYCWGNNTFGQAADGTRSDDKLTPVETMFGMAKDISAGTQNTCALLQDDTFACTGYNGDGQLGNGTTGLETGFPQPVSGITGKRIAVGNLDTCAVLEDDTAACWGANNQGQHGNGAPGVGSDVPTPVDPGLTGIDSLSAATHVCAIDLVGALSCWGRNNLGQVGDGTSVSADLPLPIALGGNLATMVGTGRNHTCAALDNDELWCWGKNAYGQLGRGTTSPNEPVPAHATVLVCP